MARLSKSYFHTLKNKNVVFKEVKGGEDIRVEIVDRNGDFKVNTLRNRSFIKETIKVRFVKVGADVKIEIVDRNGDFSIFME